MHETLEIPGIEVDRELVLSQNRKSSSAKQGPEDLQRT